VREATARGNPRHSVSILCVFMGTFSTGRRVTAALHHWPFDNDRNRPSSAIGARLTTLRCRAKQRQQRGGKCGLGCQIPLIGSGPGAGWQIIRRQPSG
jgi:hypothetical protein